MAVCHKKKFIFFHNPRTGGTNITQALKKAGCELEFYGDKHMGYCELEKYVPDIVDACEKAFQQL